VVRAFKSFQAHHMTDRAAGLTYYAMLSLFPALLLAMALLGALGQEGTVSDIVDYLSRKGLDPGLASAIQSALSAAVNATGGAISGALIGGIAGSLYGASGGFAATGRALNEVYGVEEDRPFVRRKALDVGCTLVGIAFALVVLVLIFLGGGAAHDLFATIGLGSTATTVWNIARWPAAVVLAALAHGFIYAFAPNVKPRRWRWISPGALAGVGIWILASVGFFIYIKYATHKTYGVFGAAVLLLLWLWLSSVALLFGAELNLAIETAERAGSASAPQAGGASPQHPGPTPEPRPGPAPEQSAG
jgi:membrane protein